MAATSTLDQLALIASQKSGLPVPFTKALIALEGTYQNGHNNPFDVTSGWARLAGVQPIAGGDWGSQGNIASFASMDDAIAAWARGILTFSNYARFRADWASGASAYQLAKDLQDAGYAGDSTTYAQSLAALVQEYGGSAPTMGPNQPASPSSGKNNYSAPNAPSIVPVFLVGLVAWAVISAL